MKTLKMDEKTEERVLDQLQFEHTELEDQICEKLSEQIHPYKKEINEALTNTATLDILLAKAQQTIDMQLCKPEISSGTTRYIKIFNPQVKEVLWQEGKKFQAIDIDIEQGACLITGANTGREKRYPENRGTVTSAIPIWFLRSGRTSRDCLG